MLNRKEYKRNVSLAVTYDSTIKSSFSVNALALERRYQKKEKKKQIEAGKGVLKGLIIIKMVIYTIVYRRWQ